MYLVGRPSVYPTSAAAAYFAVVAMLAGNIDRLLHSSVAIECG